jgi:acyltransferase-like protein
VRRQETNRRSIWPPASDWLQCIPVTQSSLAGDSPGRALIPPTERLVAIDAWRFAAAAAIVWLHTCYDGALPNAGNLGRFAVPYFSALAMYLLYKNVQRRPDQDFFGFSTKRVKRIYLPFLGWSVIYFLSSNLKRHFVSHQPLEPLGWSFFIAGTSLQLWFLPYILAATVGLFPVCRAAVGLQPPTRRIFAVVLILIAGTIAFLPAPWPGETPPNDNLPAARYVVLMSWETLPALLAGLAMAMLGLRPGMKITAALGVIVLIGATAWILTHGRNIAIENLAGVATLAAAMSPWTGPLIRLAARGGRYAYGIYLAHALFLEAFFAALGARHIRSSTSQKVLMFAAALGLSYALIWLLNQRRETRWLTGD